MKKTTTKPAARKPAAKKPTAKKPSAKPKRKASQAEFAELLERLEAVAEKLAQTAERLAQMQAAAVPPLPATPSEVHVDEHADDIEVASTLTEREGGDAS